MAAARRLLAALLCGLLLTGCEARCDAITVHVHLDAALIAALPQAASDTDGPVAVGVVVGLPDPGRSRPRPPDPVVHHAGGPAGADGHATSLGGLGGINLGAGKEVGLVLVAVVAVVLVAVVAWKIGSLVTARHVATPPATYALTLGGGADPAQLLHLRDGRALHLEPALVDALAHGGFGHATLQPTGSPVALPVQVLLDGPQLCVRPVDAVPAH